VSQIIKCIDAPPGSLVTGTCIDLLLFKEQMASWAVDPYDSCGLVGNSGRMSFSSAGLDLPYIEAAACRKCTWLTGCSSIAARFICVALSCSVSIDLRFYSASLYLA